VVAPAKVEASTGPAWKAGSAWGSGVGAGTPSVSSRGSSGSAGGSGVGAGVPSLGYTSD
jgi:hypothetical protein